MNKTLLPSLYFLSVYFLLLLHSSSFAENKIGINLYAPVDYSNDFVYADAMKTARVWYIPGSYETLASVDENGWPLEDAQCPIWHGITNMNGTYRLSYEGDSNMNVTAAWGSGSVVVGPPSYNPDTGVSTRDIEFNTTSGNGLLLIFTNTNGGVRNVKLMRPLFQGATNCYSEDTFLTDQFIDAISKFSVIRFMNFTGTNANEQQTWSDRMPPNYASFNRNPWKGVEYGWCGIGAAWETVIKICNQTMKDAWICVPAEVDDDYITQLANLFISGNEFTAPLDPSLNLYIEYSNELWNYAGGFTQSFYNRDEAISEVNDDGDPYSYDYDNCNNVYYWAFRRVGKKTIDISNIFRSALQSAGRENEMHTRIRPVLCWQAARLDVGYQSLKYLEEQYLKNDIHPNVPYYIYGGGGTAYYNPDLFSDSLTLQDSPKYDSIWENEYMDPDYRGIERSDFERNSPPLDFDTILPILVQEGHVDADAEVDPNYVSLSENFRNHFQGDPYNYTEEMFTDIHNIIRSTQNWSWAIFQKDNVNLCAAFGIKRIGYEGGPSFDDVGHSENIKAAAVNDPRITNEVIEHHNAWSNYGGELLCYYRLTGGYQWGFTETVHDLNSYKMQAIDELNINDAMPITHGHSLISNMTIDSSEFHSGERLYDVSNVDGYVIIITNYARYYGYASYTLNVEQEGTYTFLANISNATGDVEYYVDGIKIEAGQPATKLMTPGIHSIKIRATGGSFTLDSIDISVTDSITVNNILLQIKDRKSGTIIEDVEVKNLINAYFTN